MSSENHWPTSGLGLFQSLFQPSNFAKAPVMPQGAEQLLRSYARWQLEVQGLMNRRAQAYFELPGRIVQCRTPQDLMEEQQRFWQTCFEQYSSASRQIMSVWAQAFNLPVPAAQTGSESPARDYLSFPETRETDKYDGAPDITRKVA
ncbi:MAG: phasin family protein [Hyphomicrobiaceae bacterium]|nr:phasin family protein [Hyphomicrobiaceae bacterium]